VTDNGEESEVTEVRLLGRAEKKRAIMPNLPRISENALDSGLGELSRAGTALVRVRGVGDVLERGEVSAGGVRVGAGAVGSRGVGTKAGDG